MARGTRYRHRATSPLANARRALENGAHLDRAERDPDPRLSRRRDDGPAVVCRRRVSPADGRTAAAGDRPHAERRPRVVARSRRHAAVDARRAERGHLGRAAQGLRGRRHSRLRSASRRRHRVVHAVSRPWLDDDPRRRFAAAGGREARGRLPEDRPYAARLRSSLSHARSACDATVSAGDGARARRRARAADSRDRARAHAS